MMRENRGSTRRVLYRSYGHWWSESTGALVRSASVELSHGAKTEMSDALISSDRVEVDKTKTTVVPNTLQQNRTVERTGVKRLVSPNQETMRILRHESRMKNADSGKKPTSFEDKTEATKQTKSERKGCSPTRLEGNPPRVRKTGER